jgi:hypothetical protein
MPDLVDILEMVMNNPENPDIPAPLDYFKEQVQRWGWNVIKGAAKLSKTLADKVISFVEQLIEGGEWGIAPG